MLCKHSLIYAEGCLFDASFLPFVGVLIQSIMLYANEVYVGRGNFKCANRDWYIIHRSARLTKRKRENDTHHNRIKLRSPNLAPALKKFCIDRFSNKLTPKPFKAPGNPITNKITRHFYSLQWFPLQQLSMLLPIKLTKTPHDIIFFLFVFTFGYLPRFLLHQLVLFVWGKTITVPVQ